MPNRRHRHDRRRATRFLVQAATFGTAAAFVAAVVIAPGVVAGPGEMLLGALTAGSSPSGESAAAASPARVLTVSEIASASPKELFSGGLTVQPTSVAAAAVAALKAQNKTAEAATISEIASQPVAVWLGDWLSKTQLAKTITAGLTSAEATGTTPTFVTYAIPDRDCGGFSAGGLTVEQYREWNDVVASTLRGHRAAVLVEPDSLAMLSRCPQVASERLPLIRSAVTALSSAGVTAYLDGGNSNWVDPATMASRLTAAGIGSARGFFTNVSNFYPLANETAYADKVSALTGGSHYVVDVSRNGQGWKGTWCNPPGAGLGKNPQVSDGLTKLDATLWVKTPGASDGTCNGGPTAGTWWESYALDLVRLRAS
jgi:endoglucanase